MAYTVISDTTSVESDIGTLTNTGGTATLGGILGDVNNVTVATSLAKLGTIANTGGTATVGAILGDVANSSIAVRLTNLASQTTRAGASKAQTAIGAENLWTISNGPIRVLSVIGLITTGFEAAANEIKLQFTPTGGSAVDLCAVLDVNGAAIRKVLALNGVKATALQLSTDTGVVTLANQNGMPIVLTPGVIGLSTTDTTDGAVSWYIEFEPLATASTVAVA